MVRRLTATALVSLVLTGCAAAPEPGPSADQIDTGPAQVLDSARTVANDLEDRSMRIDSQMRDPFSPP